MRRPVIVSLLALVLSACKPPEPDTAAVPDAPTEERATPVTVTVATIRQVEETDTSVGRIEAKAAPQLTAEVGGTLTQVAVDAGERVERSTLLAVIDPEPYRLAQTSAAAEVERLQALIANAREHVQRQETMVKEHFVSRAALGDAQAQLSALREQLKGAQARLQSANLDLANTRVLAPVGGIVDQRFVAPGDFVRTGEPIFRLVSDELVRIHLPFPETLISRLKPGLPVRLSSPLFPDTEVSSTISELRPAVNPASRAIEAIVDLEKSTGWRSGASVRGAVILETRNSVTVPEAAVISRPAGKTVYAVLHERAEARIVETGEFLDGAIEIRNGLDAGTTVAVDGAGFLTDGAKVVVQESGE